MYPLIRLEGKIQRGRPQLLLHGIRANKKAAEVFGDSEIGTDLLSGAAGRRGNEGKEQKRIFSSPTN